MTRRRKPRPGGKKRLTRGFLAEIVHMIDLRREMAELEFQADIRNARGLATGGGIGLVLFLTGVPVLAVLAAHSAAGQDGQNLMTWLLGIGLGCLVLGALTGLWSWLRFRRNLVGFRATLDELREDITWLQEWTGTPDEGDDATEEDA